MASVTVKDPVIENTVVTKSPNTVNEALTTLKELTLLLEIPFFVHKS